LDVRLAPLAGKGIHDGGGIVSFDDAGTDHGHGHQTQADRQELVVCGLVVVDVFHRKVRTFL
jgi:hypothetical protein